MERREIERQPLEAVYMTTEIKTTAKADTENVPAFLADGGDDDG